MGLGKAPAGAPLDLQRCEAPCTNSKAMFLIGPDIWACFGPSLGPNPARNLKSWADVSLKAIPWRECKNGTSRHMDAERVADVDAGLRACSRCPEGLDGAV